jgi:hypothetical protein
VFGNCSSLSTIWIPSSIRKAFHHYRRHLKTLDQSQSDTAVRGVRHVEGWSAVWDQCPE